MISIIIINYNTFSITSDCIRSIVKYTHGVDYEIILVDNASIECEPELFLNEFPGIKLVKSPSNLGFSKGNNLGISHAKGDMILLLNSDTYFTDNILYKTLTYFDSLENVGFLGVKMVYPNGSIQHTARKFRSIGWELLDLFRFIPMILPYHVRARLMQGKYFKGDFNMECDWLNGAFLMFNKSLLSKFTEGKLDERFFMYGEDHLWGYQVKLLGLHNYYYNSSSIVHINNASTSPDKRIQLLKTIYRNELEIAKLRKGDGVYYWIFLAIYGLKEQSRILIKSIFDRQQ